MFVLMLGLSLGVEIRYWTKHPIRRDCLRSPKVYVNGRIISILDSLANLLPSVLSIIWACLSLSNPLGESPSGSGRHL